MPKFIKIERSDMAGGYTETVKNIAGAVEGEFDDINCLDNGTQITLTVVEMSQEEYESLPEFDGW